VIKKVIWAAPILLSLTLVLPGAGAAGDQERPDLRPAFLVVDVQNIWLPLMAEGDRNPALAKINEAIALLRCGLSATGCVLATAEIHCPDHCGITLELRRMG
jgi:hypothetical protein